VICAGQASSITVSGAASYSWSNNSTASLIVVSPSLTTTYTISGISTESCVSTVAFTQSVSACLGIEAIAGNEQHVMIYPNPNAGEFTISHVSDLDLVIVDELGRTVQSLKLNESNEHQVQMKDLSNGIYFILSTGNAVGVKQKIIVSK